MPISCILSLAGNNLLGNWNALMSQSKEDQLIAGVPDDIGAIVDHILVQGPDIPV